MCTPETNVTLLSQLYFSVKKKSFLPPWLSSLYCNMTSENLFSFPNSSLAFILHTLHTPGNTPYTLQAKQKPDNPTVATF